MSPLPKARPPRTSDNVLRASNGQKIKRAAERGLLPFLDDPEALKAELLRRITERAKRR